MCEKRGERGRCSVAGFSWIGGRIYRVDNAVERKEGIDGRVSRDRQMQRKEPNRLYYMMSAADSSPKKALLSWVDATVRGASLLSISISTAWVCCGLVP